MCCDVEYRADTCEFEGKVTKIPLKRKKEKQHSFLLIFTPSKIEKQKLNFYKTEGINYASFSDYLSFFTNTNSTIMTK